MYCNIQTFTLTNFFLARHLERTAWRLRKNSIKKYRWWQKKEKLLFLIKVKCKLENGSRLLTMTLTGVDPHIIKESIPMRPLLGIEQRPPMNHIGLQLETGYPDGKENNHLWKEMGGHHFQEKVSIMIKRGTEESGDLHLIDMNGDRDHLFQEMKGIFGLHLPCLGETEGLPFLLMNVKEGFLSCQMNKIEGPLG